jgi:hypothetical protein
MTPEENKARVREILARVKLLAAEYYRLTGRPLGVTGEVGEWAVADQLNMTLASVRETGFDALRGEEKVQIKTRAKDSKFRNLGRMSRISVEKSCHTVMLAILDIESLDLNEIWEAPFAEVVKALNQPGSKARERGQLSVSKFKSFARKIWDRTEGKRGETVERRVYTAGVG